MTHELMAWIVVAYLGDMGEMWRDAGEMWERCGEMWGMWGGARRCGAMWGDVGRYGEIAVAYMFP